MAKLIQILGFSAAILAASTALAESKVPQTAEDHLALASQYREKAGGYRQLASFHREMAEAYRRSVAPPVKGQDENPWAKKMARHCQLLIDDAERMAAGADRAAEYHALRARELSGQ